MKLKNILCALIICSAFIGVATANPTTPSQSQAMTVATDSLSSIKLKALNIKKASLETQIKSEDAKRNASINGVSPETMEELNIKQDSVCLELRSQLSDTNIEIAEIKRNNLTNIVNTAINNREEVENK